MEKLKKYIGKTINIEKIKDSYFLNDCRLCCTRLPEDISEFEEIEFSISDVTMCVAVLEGKIKRIMFVKVDKSDPDIGKALSKEELEHFLKINEENLIKFFENITI